MGRRIQLTKEISIGTLFVRYIVRLVVSIVGIFIVMSFSFLVLGWSKVIYPAYYAEQQAVNAINIMREKGEFQKELVPELCDYVYFDLDGNVLSTDLSDQETKNLWKILNGEYRSLRGYYFKTIEFQNGHCVLRYKIVPEYRSATLRKILIKPQTLILGVAVTLCVTSIIIFAIRFGKRIEREMQSIIEVATKVQDRDLDFEMKVGKVKEINHVLFALDKMRNELQSSLQKQWQDTELRKRQISELAHDLKTPITIIKGNAEIMEDTNLTTDQVECLSYINSSISQMQEYVGLLIEVNRSEKSMKPKFELIPIAELIEELNLQTKGLCQKKELEYKIYVNTEKSDLVGDRNLLIRAIMNIITNAIEYSPNQGKIMIELENDENYMRFVVQDEGPGFSAEGLKYATSQFFMEDSSRNRKDHYGIGLYMASTVAKAHGGYITLENRTDRSGARVRFIILSDDGIPHSDKNI